MKFNNRKDYIICIDSDGSAIDSMNIKHYECFGPCLIKEFSLSKYKDELLEKWAQINLFSITRGVNRFKTQYLFLKYVDENITKIDGINELKNWTETSLELSNSALKLALEHTHSDILQKTLYWSLATNTCIEKLSSEKKKSFKGVKEFLSYAKEFSNIAIVSSANYEALISEWQGEDILRFVDIVLSQDNGTKSHCIAQLINMGYKPNKVLMIGDAPTDLTSAKENGVYFFPILVDNEAESWAELKSTAIELFFNGNYKEYNIKKEKEFLSILI